MSRSFLYSLRTIPTYGSDKLLSTSQDSSNDVHLLDIFFHLTMMPYLWKSCICYRRTFLTSRDSISAMIVSRYSLDRKSTRLNSSHVSISYAVFCLTKKPDTLYDQIQHLRQL